jgi:RecA/RadA recombinase
MAKDKSKKEVLAEIKGKTMLIGLSDKTPYFVNTGHYGLNMVVSGRWAGGWPGGRVSEVFGDPSSGKSILMMRAMISMQRGEILIVDDGYVKDDSFILLDDTEKAYVSEFCTSLGFDVTDVVEMKKSKTVEGHFINAMETLAKIRGMNKSAPIGVFLDSIAQLSTAHEVKVGMGKRDMDKAGKIHQAMRLYSDDINEFGAFYLIANHVIANIGAMFGPQRIVKGGSGIAFQSSVRVDLKYKSKFIRNKQKTDESGDRGEAYGTKIVAIAEKNKITTPFKFTAMDIYYATGVDPYSGLFDYFSRQGNLIMVEDAKGGKNPKPAQFEYRSKDDMGNIADKVGVTFEKKDFEHFIIDNDILGLKKQKIAYMEPLAEAPEYEEVIEDEGGEPQANFTPAPPPVIEREAKI